MNIEKEIPILDMKPGIDSQWYELTEAISNVMRSGHFILGPKVKELEAKLASFFNVKHAIGVNSGTDALFLGLRASGIGPGDEVITTPFTFFATAEAISHVGATPVFVDVNPKTYNIDVSKIAEKITPRTKGILAVHLFGEACDLSALLSLCKKHNLLLFEDVAQAFGATYENKYTGTFGEFGAFSFFPSKNLGTFGDGGLVTTNNDALAEEVRKLRAHGSKKKYFNETIGYNSRLDELHAAILLVRFQKIVEWNQKRNEAAKRYHALLAPYEKIMAPTEATNQTHVFHQYTVRLLGVNRDKVQEQLSQENIQTMVYYPVPLHKLPVYSSMNISCPIAEQLATEVISLPIWPEITAEIQDRVVKALVRATQN